VGDADEAVLSRSGARLFFYCPGCKCAHSYNVEPGEREDGTALPVWEWDGNMTSPTFSPSLRCNGDVKDEDIYPHTTAHRCHLFVRSGKIQYCADCTHGFAGRIVAMEPFGEW